MWGLGFGEKPHLNSNLSLNLDLNLYSNHG
jgi:hypothetical protein